MKNKKSMDEDVIIYPNVRVEGDFVKKYNSTTKQFERIASKVNIEKVLINIDTGSIYYKLRYLYLGDEREITVLRIDCQSKNCIIKLSGRGVDVNSSNATTLIQHLNNEEKRAAKGNIHSEIGFSIYEKKAIFKHYKAIGLDSNYEGRFNLKPKGKHNKWMDMVKKYVIGNTALEVALIIGFSSAIVGRLKLESIVAHLYGNSTTGKTTSTILAISCWGNPRNGSGNLFSTWNATSNAIFSQLAGNHGVAVALDEISMSNEEDFTKDIYKFSSGKDKERLSKNAVLKEAGTWETTIITNGEHSILSKSKKNIGIKMRVLEFGNVNWTKNAKSADEIKRCCVANYGRSGCIFVKKLMQYEIKELRKAYSKQCKLITNKFKENNINDEFVERRAQKYGVLTMTADLLKKFFDLDIDMENIIDFFIDKEKENFKSRNIQKNAYEYFMEQYEINQKRFIVEEKNEMGRRAKVLQSSGSETWGRFVNKSSRSEFAEDEICIYPFIFKKIMKEGGFEDTSIILKEWKKNGILDAENDRYTRKRKINSNGVVVKVYVIKIKK